MPKKTTKKPNETKWGPGETKWGPGKATQWETLGDAVRALVREGVREGELQDFVFFVHANEVDKG
jgi:hypothetical protein